jgi:hypothetical protein
LAKVIVVQHEAILQTLCLVREVDKVLSPRESKHVGALDEVIGSMGFEGSSTQKSLACQESKEVALKSHRLAGSRRRWQSKVIGVQGVEGRSIRNSSASRELKEVALKSHQLARS